MSAPPILALRRAIVSHLKADPIVTAVLPAAQQFGERSDKDTPWPFSRIGELEGAPGHEIVGAIHIFSKSDFTDEVAQIAERIGLSLDSVVLYLGDTPGDGPKANVSITRTRIIPDAAEQSAWHAIVAILATVAKDCADA